MGEDAKCQRRDPGRDGESFPSNESLPPQLSCSLHGSGGHTVHENIRAQIMSTKGLDQVLRLLSS
jgi:hypothetical protein